MRHASFFSTVFPQWAALRFEHMTLVQQHLVVDVASTRRRAKCPDCGQCSQRVHSLFTRLLSDLPVASFPVCIHLHGRRFRCLNSACPRQTFRERFPTVALPYQRRTPALRSRLEAVGFSLGGQAGRRLVAHLQLATRGTSRNSLLRLVRQAVVPGSEATSSPLRVLGVDDFAFRRGVRYGAIVVNLEQHRVVDVLANREAATVAAWLEHHGAEHVKIVTRDRSGAFAEAVRQAAPQATQVADRFHLLDECDPLAEELVGETRRLPILSSAG